MITNIITIGNSQGIRIPKPLLKISGLEDEVELVVKKGEIKLIAASKKTINPNISFLSENTLAQDWNRPEEDKAWKKLQSEA